MIQIFTFNTSMMNGTVTMQTHTDAFASKDLAEKARLAVIEANKDSLFRCGFGVYCSEVVSTTVFESEDEIPLLNKDV